MIAIQADNGLFYVDPILYGGEWYARDRTMFAVRRKPKLDWLRIREMYGRDEVPFPPGWEMRKVMLFPVEYVKPIPANLILNSGAWVSPDFIDWNSLSTIWFERKMTLESFLRDIYRDSSRSDKRRYMRLMDLHSSDIVTVPNLRLKEANEGI